MFLKRKFKNKVVLKSIDLWKRLQTAKDYVIRRIGLNILCISILVVPTAFYLTKLSLHKSQSQQIDRIPQT